MKSQTDGNRKLAATVQQTGQSTFVSDSCPLQSTGSHTLTAEQYEQLLALLNKQHLEFSPHVEQQHSAYLAGKSFCLLTTQPQQSWIVDSGATNHITPHLHLFRSFSIVPKACYITMPNGRQVEVKHIGTVLLNPNIILQGVLHAPDFQFNLLSASKLAR